MINEEPISDDDYQPNRIINSPQSSSQRNSGQKTEQNGNSKECSKLSKEDSNLNAENSRNSSEGSSQNRDSKNYGLNEEDDILQEREDDGMRIQGGVYYSQSKRDLNSCEDEEEERDSEYDDEVNAIEQDTQLQILRRKRGEQQLSVGSMLRLDVLQKQQAQGILQVGRVQPDVDIQDNYQYQLPKYQAHPTTTIDEDESQSDILNNENCENPEEEPHSSPQNSQQLQDQTTQEDGRINICDEYEATLDAQSKLPHLPERLSSEHQSEVVQFSGGVKASKPESLYYLSIHKAGLEGVDKEKLHQVITEASKNSDFYKSEEKKLGEVREKCKRYKERVEHVRKDQGVWERIKVEVERKIDQLKQEADMSRTWIHVDMDAFYAAVEMRDDISLCEKPIAVSEKNMIMTTNYVARKFGVRSGVPAFIGKRLCPDIIFIKPDFAKYKKASEEFKEVLRSYDANLESIGLDEANMDITDYLHEHKLDHQEGRICVGERIRRDIIEKTRMTASCGIACNKMLAKICSDMNKPNGQTYLPSKTEEIWKFMENLPVRKLVGVGKVNEQILHGMGIEQCRDVVDKAIEIYINFTENAFDFLVKSAIGIAKNLHDEVGIKKSINVSETFPIISEYDLVKSKLENLCSDLEKRAKAEKLSGRTITLEFKNEKFKNKQRSYTVSRFMQTKEQFLKIAMNLLNTAWPLEPVRQIQVKLLNLRDDKGNMSESAMDVMYRTGGSLKLGGNPKDILPQALVKVMQEEGVGLPASLAGCNGPVMAPQQLMQQQLQNKYPKVNDDPNELRPIIHHHIKPMFPEEQEAEELKKQRQKDYYQKQNYFKKQTLAVRAGQDDHQQQGYQKPYYNNKYPYNNNKYGAYNKYNNQGGKYNNNYYNRNQQQYPPQALKADPKHKPPSLANQPTNSSNITPELQPSEKPPQEYKDRFRSGWQLPHYANNRQNSQQKQFTGKVSQATQMNEVRALKNFSKHNRLFCPSDQFKKVQSLGKAESANASSKQGQQKDIKSFVNKS